MAGVFRRFAALLCLTALAAPTQAQAWPQVAPGQWADPTRACTYRTEQRGQAFPLMGHQDAVKLSGEVRQSLIRQGMREVSVRPAARGQHWGLLASYVYPSTEGEAQVAQLYLSQRPAANRDRQHPRQDRVGTATGSGSHQPRRLLGRPGPLGRVQRQLTCDGPPRRPHSGPAAPHRAGQSGLSGHL
ncbi:hypothetical protein [Deinococcus radiophilus]|uniref:hypothetical protein n=1 Tax=Deinococcus radiophilus TaxID=32062 RepID=UPI0036144CB5